MTDNKSKEGELAPRVKRYSTLALRMVFVIALAVVTFESLIAPAQSSTPSNFDKLVHFGAYFVLMYLATLAYPKFKLWVLGLFLFAWGGGIEIAQELMNRGRDGSLADQLANGGGVGAAFLLVKIFVSYFKRP